jgi:hypothetical protein
MFGLFKKETPVEKLEKKYRQMLADAYKLSHTDRAASDKLQAAANEVMKEIETLTKGNG